jgi:hypothetical protein
MHKMTGIFWPSVTSFWNPNVCCWMIGALYFPVPCFQPWSLYLVGRQFRIENYVRKKGFTTVHIQAIFSFLISDPDHCIWLTGNFESKIKFQGFKLRDSQQCASKPAVFFEFIGTRICALCQCLTSSLTIQLECQLRMFSWNSNFVNL